MIDDENLFGRVNSVQLIDKPNGIGADLVFNMQGCSLRCSCCDCPDMWDALGGSQISLKDACERVAKHVNSFDSDGRVILSGGEPLLQVGFAVGLFSFCRDNNIHTCLDTSGCFYSDKIDELLSLTDLVLLDIKYTDEDKYIKYVGCSADKPLEFLIKLDEKNIKTHICQVLIKGKNDDRKNLVCLSNIVKSHNCIEKCTLLPFSAYCMKKYEKEQLDFPFADIEDTDERMMIMYQGALDSLINDY